MTITPSATPADVADRLPQKANQAFSLLITEDELTGLAMKEAEQIVGAWYDRLSVTIHPDKILVTAFGRFYPVATRGVDILAEGVPTVVDGQVRFQVTQLTLHDEHAQLTDVIRIVIRNTLDGALYFLDPEREAHIGAVQFTTTGVRLREGAMVVEGVTE
jgi:hypothetical protein